MSDHWNSLANLLGTPSLAPQKPKTESSVPVAAENPAVSSGDRDASPEVASEKPKSEKSRLKTSWDTVANFFGVTTKEPEEVREPQAEESPAAKAPTTPKAGTVSPKPASRKGKPSMWESATDVSEEDSAISNSTEALQGESPSNESPNRREPAKRESARRDVQAQEPPRRRDSDTGRDSGTRGKSGERLDSGSDEGLQSDGEPERRSHRRPPRRGRDAEPRDRDSQPRDVASVKDREQPRHSDRQESRAERNVSPRSAVQRSHEPRTSASKQESLPAKKQSGFGAGIVGEDDDFARTSSNFDDEFQGDETHARTHDVRDDVDERSHDDGSASSEEDSRPRRRRRRGGRGRKHRDDADIKDEDRDVDARTSRTSRDDDSDEQSSDDGPSVRHVKIPSWTETISVLVEANMLNHQRSQSSPRGNSRGRGRR